MSNQTSMTALCACSFGAAPMPLVVSSQTNVMACNMLAATVMDNAFVSFGMCSNPANPTVAAATAAALGVLTPMPCLPAVAAPWTPGAATVMIGNKPALNSTSKLMCSYGGVIQISMPVAMTVMLP
ncbi:hypothetical protein FACS1894133_1800 [Clostridia bacterium]|nr:hypothetical protein FACS1894133_1800 [Clostridia bacterium]